MTAPWHHGSFNERISDPMRKGALKVVLFFLTARSLGMLKIQCFFNLPRAEERTSV